MMKTSLRRTAVILLAALSPLALDGCVSAGLSRSALEPGASGTGAVEMSVFLKERDLEARTPVGFPVFSELFRVDPAGDRLVARSMAAAWILHGIDPGRYRLEASKRIDDAGNIQPLGSPVRKEFDVRAGEKASVSIVLEKVPVFWIVLAAITIVVLVILSIDWIRQGKIPLPPLPPPPPLPFPAIVVTGDHVTPIPGGPSAQPAPAVADVFPAPGSEVTGPRVTTSFLLTCPLSPHGIEKGAITALGSRSGLITGMTSWIPDEQVFAFIPTYDLFPGEEVTVTLDLSRLTGESGQHGSGKASTTFKVLAQGR
ncbi:MAG: hypothetical protein DIJKHBIC_03951 [Thermoanaerobaculia bacterium]|nr:hypothetical protein [Thermoanaerobaculia bacterium]